MLVCCATNPNTQDNLVRTPLLSTTMRSFPRGNEFPDPKLADGNTSGQLALCPQVLICPFLLQGHHPMVTSLLDWSEVIIWPMKRGNGERKLELGLIVTMSCHPWDSNAKNKPTKSPATRDPGSFELTLPPNTMSHLLQARVHPPNHLRMFQPVRLNLRCLNTIIGGTFCLLIFFFYCFPVPNFPSPLLQPSPACPATPCLFIIIDDTPIGSPPPSTPTVVPATEIPPIAPKNSTPSSPHSHNGAHQEFINLKPTLLIPQEIFHDSINRILLENC
ncbi:hypothetical protein O181_066180 [Austropuccinia psidii MF-1]|uniref:Uncharacterized protein n=1 Tax=Austropuccinia psidii MF-1 TaxID=1389203 RepID=A0A9Q3I4V1_9BASI|nr:hypothetical protein [Austropuccinia psidii MF-1]